MDVQDLVLYAFGMVCLLNLVLVVRLVKQLRMHDTARANLQHDPRSQLTVGAVAPPFHAMTLTGKGITEERFAGQATAFVFVSPNCGGCRTVLGMLAQTAPLAQAAGVETVLVTDVGPERTRSWLKTVEYEDGVQVALPVLAAPASRTRMVIDYDPQGVFPYFCLIDRDRLARTRGVFGGPEWAELVRRWQSTRMSALVGADGSDNAH